MKKILFVFIILCCCKFTLVAQQITSNLTLITTDMMSTEQKSNFNWQSISYPRPAARYYFPAIYILLEPVEGSGTGGNGGSGVTNICYCVDKGGSTGILEEIYPGQFCYKCIAGGHDCVGTECGPISGGSSGSSQPFNWGIWGNQVPPYTPFNYPPPSPPLSGSWGSSGGSAPPPPTGPSYPPPDKPMDADDPGGAATQPIKKDTVQPSQWDCDSAKIARGNYATNMWKQVDTTGTDVKRLRDSAVNGKFESAFQIMQSNDKYVTKNFFTSTSSTNVQPPNPSPTDTIKGGAHCHQDTSGVNSNSPSDFFRLLTMHKFFPTYSIDYVTSYDNSEWAIMIGDSVNASVFINNNQPYSIIDSIGENKNDWSNTKINPTSKNTFYDDYFKIGNKLYDKGYPKNLLTAFANVIMTNGILNTGIKVLMKVGDSFKELSFEEKNDPVTKEKTYTIKICK